MMATPQPGSEQLHTIAAAHGVATSYRDERRRTVHVDDAVVIRVLGLLQVQAETDTDRRRELARLAEQRRAGQTPATIAVRVGAPARPVPGARMVISHEDNTRLAVRDELPPDLPAGWYEVELANDQRATLIVAPQRVPSFPPTWGWMVQSYALRSQRSWGIGDLGDVREFVAHTATAQGAGAVLLNPLHAPNLTHPVQPSPYSPSSRLFTNPLTLRIEDLQAYQFADPRVRGDVDALRVSPHTELIDHDLVWAAKRSALELLWNAAGRPAPPMSPSLRDWATYCALAERHGARPSAWPVALRDVASPAVARARDELASRVALHAWVQQQCGIQLAAVRDTARAAGMELGVLHDLAVGVNPDGADAWALADVLATGATVGAPPDNFSPHGQDWGLPPWRPDRLAATGYAAVGEMTRAVLAHADGLRIDHVAGLWRLWWVPPGESPDRGTYVHYDAETMLAVLALEAHRAGATIIGEDLGTVEPEVTQALAERGMLGCAVSWFTRDETAPGQPLLTPDQWPARAAASLSTHDLPTAAGFLRGEHVRARAELGLLDDVVAEFAAAHREREELLTLLRSLGFLTTNNLNNSDPNNGDLHNGDAGELDEAAIIVAMHRLLAATPCQLKLISPYDVLAEPRQPNLPGTIDQYPNWRLPLPVTLEQLCGDPRVAAVTELFRQSVSKPR